MITVITSFNIEAWNLYAKKMVTSFIEYWDKNIEGPIDSIDFCSSHSINYNLMFVDCDFTIH